MRSTSGFPRVSPEGSAYSTGTALQSPKDPSIAIPRVAGVVVNIEARIGARTIRRTTAAIPARDRAHSRPADGRAPAGRPRRPFVNPFPFTRPFVRPSPRANNQPIVTADSVATPFGKFFADCEAQLKPNVLSEWPHTAVDLGHPALAGVPQSEVESALVFGCGADVFSP